MPGKKRPKHMPPRIFKSPEPLRLDLGSGPRPAEGFKGVDIVKGVTDFTQDLCCGDRWAFADNSVDEMRSSHFIEHIYAGYVVDSDCKRADALLFFFDEAFRIAKPGATFTVQWPALQGVRAFQDPTHRRFIPAETMHYLSRQGREQMGVSHYGATCNWITHSVVPTIPAPVETEEDKAMALRADSSDDKIKWFMAKQSEQARRYQETWNFSQDFIAVLKADK